MGYQLNLKGSSDLGHGTAKAVWHDGTYVYIGYGQTSLVGYLVACTFNGSSFTVVSTASWSSNRYVQAIYGDGTYIYLGTQASNGELRAFKWNAGALEEITGASLNLGSIGVKTIYCDSQGYIYVGGTNGYIYAYTFNGSTFTLRGSVGAFSVSCDKIIGDGAKIHAAGNATLALKAYSFNGTTFTAAGTRSAHSQIPYGLANMGGGKIAAVYWGRYIDILTYNGSSYTQDHSTYFSDGSNYFWDCVTDGRYLFICKESEYLGAFLPGVSSTTKESVIVDTGILQAGNHIMAIDNGYVFYISGNYIKAARMDLTAQFTADKTAGHAPLTVNFTAT